MASVTTHPIEVHRNEIVGLSRLSSPGVATAVHTSGAPRNVHLASILALSNRTWQKFLHCLPLPSLYKGDIHRREIVNQARQLASHDMVQVFRHTWWTGLQVPRASFLL